MLAGTNALASIVLDASVVVKWYLADEAEVAAAVRVREAIVSGAVTAAVPSLLSAELAHAVVRATRQERLTAETATAVVLTHARFEEALDIAAVTGTRAVEEALSAGVGAYDGAYLALARDRGAPLVTADRRLYEQAIAGGIDALWLGDAPVSSDTVG